MMKTPVIYMISKSGHGRSFGIAPWQIWWPTSLSFPEESWSKYLGNVFGPISFIIFQRRKQKRYIHKSQFIKLQCFCHYTMQNHSALRDVINYPFPRYLHRSLHVALRENHNSGELCNPPCIISGSSGSINGEFLSWFCNWFYQTK